MPARAKTSKEAGFTIVEVMVAVLLLLIGMMGTVAMVERADDASASTRAREGGTNLAREVVEQARTVPYTGLNTAALSTALQAIPGLTTGGGAGTWTLRRRNITYTVSADVCAVDDPRDGLGDHTDGGTYCAGSATGTVDTGAQDFKQVTAQVSYAFRGQAKQVVVKTLIATNGVADAPVMTDLKATTPTFTDPREPIVTSTGTTSVVFDADSSANATKVIWSVDGLDKGTLLKGSAANIATNKWRFTLPLTGIVDGDYAVGVRGVDANGAEGVVREITLRIVRGPSAAVQNLVAGPNKPKIGGTATNVVELEWLQSPEKNVYGYHVYRETASGSNTYVLACPANSSILDKTASCVDQSPTYARYKVMPVYQNAAGNMVESTNVSLVGPVPPPGPATLWPTSINAASTTNCNATSSKTLAAAAPTGTDLNGPIGSSAGFCTTAAAPGLGFLAGPSTAHLWLQNTHNGQSCNFDLNLTSKGPSGTTVVGTKAATVPNRTDTVTKFDIAIPHSAFTVGSTSRLMLDITGATGTGCGSTTVHLGSAAYPSSIDLPGAGAPPNAPTGLSAVRKADGSVDLSWTAPSGGPTVAFYRIYRGGTNVANRVDRTGSATPTSYTDPKPPASSTYYVTAVTATLGESAPLGPVTG